MNTKTNLSGVFKLLTLAIILFYGISKVNAESKPSWFVSGYTEGCICMASRVLLNDNISEVTIYGEMVEKYGFIYNADGGLSHANLTKITRDHDMKCTWTDNTTKVYNALVNKNAVIFHTRDESTYHFPVNNNIGQYVFLYGAKTVNGEKMVYVTDPLTEDKYINKLLPLSGINKAKRNYGGGDYCILEATGISSLARSFITNMYKKCLGRTPANNERDYWARGLTKKQFTGAAVAQGFFESAEFIKRDLVSSSYIIALYQALLQRDPDSEGLDFWIKRLHDHSRHEVLRDFVYSDEFATVCTKHDIIRGTMP